MKLKIATSIHSIKISDAIPLSWLTPKVTVILMFLCAPSIKINGQTHEEKKEIKSCIEKIRSHSTPDISAEINKISAYFKKASTRFYTAKKIKSIKLPEFDNIIGEGVVPIETINGFPLEIKVLDKITFEERPYTLFKMGEDLRLAPDAGQNNNKEKYRKLAYKQIIKAAPLTGIKSLLEFYLKNDQNNTIFNSTWTTKEINSLLTNQLNNPDTKLAYLDILKASLSGRTANAATPVTNFIFTEMRRIEDELYRPILAGRPSNFPLIYRSFSYLNSLSPEARNQALSSELIGRINCGISSLYKETASLFASQLKASDKCIDSLVVKYNNYYSFIRDIINTQYLPQNQIPNLPITKQQLQSDPNNPNAYFLNFELIRDHIAGQIISNPGQTKFVKALVDEAMSQLVIDYYVLSFDKNRSPNTTLNLTSPPSSLIAQSWLNSNFQSGNTGFDWSRPNTKNSRIEKFARKGKIKSYVLLSREFNLNSYRVFERTKVKLKSGRKVKIEYVGDLPLKLRNILKVDTKRFDLIDYSFLERMVAVKFNKNRPFADMVNIIINNPTESFHFSLNSLSRSDFPRLMQETAIRESINSGFPDKLNRQIGLKLNYQKQLVKPDIFTSTSSAVAAAPFDAADKQSFISQYSTQPNIVLDRCYINYFPNTTIANQRAVIDKLLGSTVIDNGSLRFYSLIHTRASELPQKADCKWYQALWCNAKRNRAFNDAKGRMINFASSNIQKARQNLSTKSLFNYLNISNARTVKPFYTVLDVKNKVIYTLVKLIDDNGEHIIGISDDSLKGAANISEADLFWKKHDEQYLQRYNVDLSNLSDHGYEYFARLTQGFILENTSSNTIIQRLLNEGITKHYTLFPNDAFQLRVKNSFIENLQLECFYLFEDRDLIEKINNNNPIVIDQTRVNLNTAIRQTDAKVTQGLQQSFDQINSSFNDAMERWNEWSIFIGFMSTGNSSIPIVAVNFGSLSISIAIPMMGTIPIIPLPHNFINFP